MADDTEVKLAFERVKRDCLYNTNAKPGDRLIYDYDVYADGKHVAKFESNSYKRGYRLADLVGRGVPAEDGKSVIHAKSQENLYQVTRAVLHRIPTPEQIEAYKAELAEEAAAEQRRCEERDRIERIKEAAVELLGALYTMTKVYPEAESREQIEAHAIAVAAISRATSKEEKE